MGNFNMSDFMNNVSKKDIRKGGRVENIDVRKLRPSSDEKNFYHISEESINKLAASIELLGGVQENLVVKPIDGTDEYEVIAGHTRRMASLKLLEEGKEQFSLVPCKVEDRNDSVRDELILIMTNSTQRVRTDAEKMVEAQRLRSLITEYRKEHDDLSGSTQEIIGNILGISKSKVGRLDNINRNLQPELKKEFESGKLNTSTANEIAGLPEDKQKELSEELQEKGSLSMKDVFAKKMLETECSSEDQEEALPVVESEVEHFSAEINLEEKSSDDGADTSKKCNFKNCFLCSKECNDRKEQRQCVEAPCGNPFSCTTMNVLDIIKQDVGSQCMFINDELAPKYPDGDPRPCCKECKNTCGYQCRKSIEIEKKKNKSKYAFRSLTTWFIEETGNSFHYYIRKILREELKQMNMDKDAAAALSKSLYLELSDISRKYKKYILEKMQEGESE